MQTRLQFSTWPLVCTDEIFPVIRIVSLPDGTHLASAEMLLQVVAAVLFVLILLRTACKYRAEADLNAFQVSEMHCICGIVLLCVICIHFLQCNIAHLNALNGGCIRTIFIECTHAQRLNAVSSILMAWHWFICVSE